MSSIPQLARLTGFSPGSRIWVYVCNRPLSAAETSAAEEQLARFCREWTAHNQALKAVAEIFQQQFLILMVDETQADASGCSIDKSVHFLENLGKALDVDFFERMRFGWLDEEYRLKMGNPAALAAAVADGSISDETLMVNTLVQTRAELFEKWLVPFGKSWHRRLVPKAMISA